ncbi:MAG TPA: EpsI family protein, partial [Methanosarcina sp.]|nr:EpsI family protein [Methanosarcina sp.]
SATAQLRRVPFTLYLSLLLLLCSIPLSKWLPTRQEVIPQRQTFLDFPRVIGKWTGRPVQLEKEYIDELKFSDYAMMDFKDDSDQAISFYVAWYDSQKKGRSAHSPKTCLPGGGWRLSEFKQVEFPDLIINNQALSVNHAIIQKENQKQVVYYWFQQRGRIITNEYLVKFYLLLDGITENRSDGALVRLVAPVPLGNTVEEVEAKMKAFLVLVIPKLPKYIPN